jgi:hypothetical protein
VFLAILSMLLTALPGVDDPAAKDVKTLLDTIEALQQPVEDFRCEFEGTTRVRGKAAEDMKIVRDDGLHESFSGMFIWKKGGNIHIESLHRRATDNQVDRRSVVVRMRQEQAEEYRRLNDAAFGSAIIKRPKDVRTDLIGSPGSIFLFDRLKQIAADDTLECSVSEDQSDGRPLEVLKVAFKGVPDSLFSRYWIDLRRSGHVVRVESYSGKVMSGRLDIKLASFKAGGAEVWMPVSGDSVGYAALVDRKPVITKEPTSLNTIYVVGGTMEFNKQPGPDVFTIKYKPGTPISDNLRKLEYEYGQQQIGLSPTKAETEKMLNEQIAKAEEQKAELVVASTSEGFAWSPFFAWGFGAAAVIALIALGMQRRAH